MPDVDISGLDRAEVLAALYNAARPQGMGFLHYKAESMTVEEAREQLAQGDRNSFDYVNGRVLKVDLSEDSFDSWLFNRDNGEGAAELAIQSLRLGEGTDNDTTRAIHEHGTSNAARDLAEQLKEQERTRQGRDRPSS